MKRALYITYDGLLDPLGQSQVQPYLCWLGQAGVRIWVLSFEKPDRLDRAAIERMRGRVIGTVAGAAVVAVVTFVVAEAELSVNIIYGLALIAAVGTIVFAHGSYTLDAAFLTATVLLGGFGSANNPTLLHGERVGLTILGAAAAFGALRFNDWLRARVDQRPEVTT